MVLYVVDFLICYQSKIMNAVERIIQLRLSKLENWAVENGFKFSRSKNIIACSSAKNNTCGTGV